MANTDVYVNKITLPKNRSDTYTGILVDTASQKPWFGTSTTGAANQTKTVSCTGFYLQTGAIISIAFTYANTYTSAKLILNVNSTGAKDVYYNNAVTSSTNTLLWDAGEQVTFMYNGTGYYFVTKSKVVSPVPQLSWYGTCSTGASTSEKAVTCSGYTLNAGNIIGVNFSEANTAATPTLNVNSTGAKSIYVGLLTPNSTYNTLTWPSGTMVYFMYDGTYYRYITSIAEAESTQPFGAGTWYGYSSTGATTSAKAADSPYYVLTPGSLITVRFTYANTVAGSLTLNVNSTGAKNILVNGTSTSSSNTLLWNDGDVLTFMYQGLLGYLFVASGSISPLTIRTWS